MKKKLYTVSETAEYFGVTETTVRNWILKGLKTETEKIIGLKPRKVIDLDDVYPFLGIKKALK